MEGAWATKATEKLVLEHSSAVVVRIEIVR